MAEGVICGLTNNYIHMIVNKANMRCTRLYKHVEISWWIVIWINRLIANRGLII